MYNHLRFDVRPKVAAFSFEALHISAEIKQQFEF